MRAFGTCAIRHTASAGRSQHMQSAGLSTISALRGGQVLRRRGPILGTEIGGDRGLPAAPLHQSSVFSLSKLVCSEFTFVRVSAFTAACSHERAKSERTSRSVSDFAVFANSMQALAFFRYSFPIDMTCSTQTSLTCRSNHDCV